MQRHVQDPRTDLIFSRFLVSLFVLHCSVFALVSEPQQRRLAFSLGSWYVGHASEE